MQSHSNPSRPLLVIVVSVVLLHAAALWALGTGLLQRAVEVVVPVEVISAALVQPQPKPRPDPPAPKVTVPAQPLSRDAPSRVAPMPSKSTSPGLVALAETTPSPNAPSGSNTVQPAAPSPVPAAASTVAVPSVQAAVKVDLPYVDAEYLRNPKPDYPRISRQRGEQGKVVIHVLIGVDGSAQAAEIQTSSGFDRLDQAALATVKGWRYVPGKRAGVAQAMWFSVPINFVME